VVAQPNNPCGTAVSREDLEMLLRAAQDSVVLVDECYFEYSQQTVVDLIDKYANLVVARTFSKTWGLPSLRFGFLVSQASNIEQLLKIRGPYDINQLSIVAVRAALAAPDYTREYVREVMEESKPLLESWLDDHKVTYWQSTANYIWAFFDKPEQLAAHLQEHDILVRPKKDPDGKLGLRVTLGNMEQTKRLIQSIEDYYQ
jgi:histidinol-phosphate aminotransferase